MAFLQFLPFLILVVLANYGEASRAIRYLVYGILVLLDGLSLLASVLFALAYLLRNQIALQTIGIGSADLSGLALTLFLVSLFGFAVLLPPVRKFLARFMSIDPSSVLHATALSLGIYYVGASVASILFAGGLAGLSRLDVETSIVELLLSGLALALFGVLGVGYFMRRNGRQTLKRLALTRMTWRQVGLVALVIVGFLALDYGIAVLWQAIDPQQYELVGKVSLGLLGTITVAKAAVIGISAGFGEEILFRGAVQPRFGLVLTAALFAAGHTQYGLSLATLEVFIVGLILGVIRYRVNTTSCIAIHGVYNFLDLLLASFFP